MALLWFEGFEGFGAIFPAASPYFAEKYTQSSNVIGSTGIDTAGRITGKALKSGGFPNQATITTPSLGNIATIVVGWAWKRNAALLTDLSGSPTKGHMIDLLEGSNLGVNIRANSSGTFDIYLGASTALATGVGSNPGNDTWVYFELKVTTNSTTGAYELKQNGSSVSSATSVNTQPGSNAYVNTVAINGAFNNFGGTMWYDDVYILDTTGSSPTNDYLGPVFVAGLLPSGAGDSTQFTPGTGSNYAQVNNNPSNDGSTYVESTTSGNQDLYQYGDLPWAAYDNTHTYSIGDIVFSGATLYQAIASTTGHVPPNGTYWNLLNLDTIAAVQVNTVAEFITSATSLKSDCKSSGTTDVGPSVALASSYGTVVRILTTDPATSAAWDTQGTGIDGAQFGFEVA